MRTQKSGHQSNMCHDKVTQKINLCCEWSTQIWVKNVKVQGNKANWWQQRKFVSVNVIQKPAVILRYEGHQYTKAYGVNCAI